MDLKIKTPAAGNRGSGLQRVFVSCGGRQISAPVRLLGSLLAGMQIVKSNDYEKVEKTC